MLFSFLPTFHHRIIALADSRHPYAQCDQTIGDNFSLPSTGFLVALLSLILLYLKHETAIWYEVSFTSTVNGNPQEIYVGVYRVSKFHLHAYIDNKLIHSSRSILLMYDQPSTFWNKFLNQTHFLFLPVIFEMRPYKTENMYWSMQIFGPKFSSSKFDLFTNIYGIYLSLFINIVRVSSSTLAILGQHHKYGMHSIIKQNLSEILIHMKFSEACWHKPLT